MRVLIVEDDLDLQLSLVDLLSKLGYAVEAVGDGVSALERLEGTDVLLADINLPGMDGLELCSQARMCNPTLGVIVMTGYDTPRGRIEAFLHSADAYLAKPFETKDLLEHLHQLMGSAPDVSEGRVPALGVRGRCS